MALKDKSIAIPSDATTVIADRQSSIGRRSEPRLLEMSIVEGNFVVQAAFNKTCCSTFGGAFERIGHSRFRVRHNLKSAPQEVYPMRVSNMTTTRNTGGDTYSNPGEQFGNDQEVRIGVTGDPLCQSGGNSNILYRSTTAHAMVLLNTTDPISDDQYSYFTIGFPVAMWSAVIKLNNLGSGDFYSVPEYWGDLLSANVDWYGAPVVAGGTQQHLWCLIGNSFCNPAPCNTNPCPTDLGPPTHNERVVRIGVGGSGSSEANGALVLVNCFCAPRNAMPVRVRVISRLWDGILGPTIVESPGSDAHPAGL